MAWETKGVRSVKNAIVIKGQSNFKSTAKDILITSQLRTALILNKKTKAIIIPNLLGNVPNWSKIYKISKNEKKFLRLVPQL